MSPKETLRGEIKNRLKEVKREEFKTQGAASAALLRSSPLWTCYKTIFLFLSMNFEIDTGSMLETALKDGKKVFVPKVSFVPKGGQGLVFYNVTSAEGPWAKGAFGIREPAFSQRESGEGEPAALEDFPALIVVPGLAFDKNGNRLGKGGGYYDRFFGELDTGRYAAVGLCMDFQVVERVPVGEKDKKMDWVLTQDELMEAKEA